MTNEIKITLDRNDIKKAILDHVLKKYPSLSHERMYIEYNSSNCYGYVIGKVKEG